MALGLYYTARMQDYDPRLELNPNIPVGLGLVLTGLGFVTVYLIVFVF